MCPKRVLEGDIWAHEKKDKGKQRICDGDKEDNKPPSANANISNPRQDNEKYTVNQQNYIQSIKQS